MSLIILVVFSFLSLFYNLILRFTKSRSKTVKIMLSTVFTLILCVLISIYIPRASDWIMLLGLIICLLLVGYIYHPVFVINPFLLKKFLKGPSKEKVEECLKKDFSKYLRNVEVESINWGLGLKARAEFRLGIYDKLFIYWEGADDTSPGFTVFDIELGKNPLLDLDIRRSDILDKISKRINIYDYVETKDSDFDGMFLMQSNKPVHLTDQFRKDMVKNEVESLRLKDKLATLKAIGIRDDIKNFIEILLEFEDSIGKLE
ncbi:MAG: hypothetical protein U9Q22_08640 [Candidatus Altiarchaeota archaeon]|nr:hypothetical protein [Candidatus Altiarchaeota archaeon]